jgi:hypothetical protein
MIDEIREMWFVESRDQLRRGIYRRERETENVMQLQ